MATLGIAPQARNPRMSALHAGATTIAALSGICALAALVAGSPLQFGVALALSGAAFIAADFIEWTAKSERIARRRVVPTARPNTDYGSRHVVFIGGGEHLSRPAPSAMSRSAVV